MDEPISLRPTLHVEILMKACEATASVIEVICARAADYIKRNMISVQVGEAIPVHYFTTSNLVTSVAFVDYSGPKNPMGCYQLKDTQLDVQAYTLKHDQDAEMRSGIDQFDNDEGIQTRATALPNVKLEGEWESLVFDDALPSQLLHELMRVLEIMRQPDLNLKTFNWNRLCLLHGPPGTGKSTLCRALAQKLSIRLSRLFPEAILFEIDCNTMLSKYFGESGKRVASVFERVFAAAQSPNTLVCVVVDEIETVATSREKSTNGGECREGLRAANQLLTALDRLRSLPNIIVLCTSNLIDEIDAAFLDRVDVQKRIPSLSPAAIYTIFRSCFNELINSAVIRVPGPHSSLHTLGFEPGNLGNIVDSPVNQNTQETPQKAPSRNDDWTLITPPMIPTFNEMFIHLSNDLRSPAYRIWAIAQKCEGFSGRVLRRLPILGLARYTWSGDCTLDTAVSALEKIVDERIKDSGT